jgi:signal transduction histidine kinase/CheY-like chemotaxis protein
MTAEDRETFEADRLSSMRVRLAAIAVLCIAIWASHALLYEDAIFPSRDYARPYRLAELVACLGLLWLVSRKRTIADTEAFGTLFLAALLPIHGLAILVVRDSCVVPFLLTMEWSQIVVALAAQLSFVPACALFGTAWTVGVAVVSLRPGFDADLADHLVLLLIYGVVAASIRAHDKLRLREFLMRREIQSANQALRDADAARTRLFVNLSHDLRTPLTLIRSEAEALCRGASEATRLTVSRIARHVRDVTDFSDQLLAAARLDAGRLEAKPAAVDLGELAGHVKAQFSGGAFDGKVHVVPGPRGDRVLARVDPAHLRRIVFNLMSNATRQLASGASRVVLSVRRDGDRAVLEVANDGPGIPEERREAIFERFRSFDTAGGFRSGIGLPIARELAELNGGTLSLMDGEPAAFRLCLPATDDPPVAMTPLELAFDDDPGETAPPAFESRERAVLLVEDHPGLRSLVRDVLAARFTVLEAGTVAAARKILCDRAPAVILCDLLLPDGRGYDVLEHVRERSDLNETPVVFFSAVAEESERVAALSAGAADYVSKPFAPNELLARVEAAAERGRERRKALDSQREDFLSELHDGVSAALARAALLLESAERRRDERSEQRDEIIRHARRAVQDALEEARALIVLRRERVVSWTPFVLELEEMLHEAAGGFGVELAFTDRTDASVPSLSTTERHALCRLSVEAVTNALRHADATKIHAEIRAEAGQVFLRVRNEVRSSRADVAKSSGFGLRAARRRLERLGGRLEAGLDPAGAWTVDARLPAALASSLWPSALSA